MKYRYISMNEAISRQKNVVELCCRLLLMNNNSKHSNIIIASLCFMLIPVQEDTLKW